MATKYKYAGVTPHGNAWQFRVKIKLEDGKVVDTIKRLDDSGKPFLKAKDAYEAKLKYIDVLKNPPPEPVLEPVVTTLRDVYNNYENTEALTKAPATIRKQDSMWKNHIDPVFGDKDINSFTPIDLSQFLHDVYKGHSWYYVQGFLRFFYLLFGHADRMGVIETDLYIKLFVNDNTKLRMPTKNQIDYQKEKDGVRVFDDWEIHILNQVFNEDNNLHIAYLLGLHCGLRISETFGLRWSNVDFDKRIITVDRQLHYEEGELRLSPVKTLTAVRDIPISDYIFEDLLFAKTLYESSKESLGHKYKDTERVRDELTGEIIVGGDFVNRKPDGELLTVNSMKYWSKKIKQEYSFDFNYHSLRHTFATRLALLQNCPFAVLKDLLGHKKLETTMAYYINPKTEQAEKIKLHCLNTLYELKPYGNVKLGVKK